MISFRYHLITLAAVFVALGVGILLGGTAGHPWFSEGAQEILAKMEAKYDRALKSNHDLKQQINRLLQEVEQRNQEVVHMMAMRYGNDLAGKKVYVWQDTDKEAKEITRLMHSVGINVVAYERGGTWEDGLLLVVAGQPPPWLEQRAGTGKWLLVEQVPDSLAKQWALLEKVQQTMTEMRVAREKS
ncbi:copper transporter [Brevibacillus agri]|uniref:copper transporter n=1 Tax=Brevibacillus TaxID=55080 RepID=UPI000423706A|nr:MULTISPECIES: copper transporter [Brevibacillus]MED1644635.1 copper transporter [Brevibacillus agri]MED1655592.1 copper transporter [Brevibacillus agri]MED1689129.1 copper transporter [Brevibacillus agri]MED1691368.1 copper transporter [Brevibacillus agri]MED1696091.1 copper transporter [Brevibacillus agri]